MTNPKLRFKLANGTAFPDWNKKQLAAVLSVKHGRDYKGLPVGTIPVLGTGGKITYVDRALCDWPCALIGRKRTINKPQYMDVPFWSVDTLFYTKPVKNNNPKFQYYLFQTIDWLKYNEASGVPSLSASTIEHIQKYIPVDQEQQKIADFFSALDEKIALAERKLSALQTLKSGLMQKIFNREIRFKREDGSNFPDWAEVKMSTMFNSIRNGFVGTIAPFYTTKETGVRYLQGTNIHDGVISDDVEYYVTQEFNQAHRKNILKEDDILMVQSGHVGDCAVVGRYAGSNCHALIVMSNANSQKYSSDFVCYYFHSSKGRKNISLLEKGNTVKHVLASDVAKLQMLLPTIEEQKKVVSVLRQMDAKQALARQELNSLILQKQAFLQQMFV